MTVSELIEWLKTQDQDATVQVIFHETGYGDDNQGDTAKIVAFDPDKHSTVKIYPTELLLGVHEG
jgi:hypothetical protein